MWDKSGLPCWGGGGAVYLEMEVWPWDPPSHQPEHGRLRYYLKWKRRRGPSDGGVCVQVKKEIPRKEQKWEHSEQKEQIRGNKERRKRINRSEEEGHSKEIWESASYWEGGSTGYWKVSGRGRAAALRWGSNLLVCGDGKGSKLSKHADAIMDILSHPDIPGLRSMCLNICCWWA